MTYREMAVEATRIAGKELMERAEELICKTEGVKSINIWINIPSLDDNPYTVPEIEVQTEVYPRREMLMKMIELRDREVP